MNGMRALCAFTTPRGRPCQHSAERHEVDDEGRAWCVPCWGTDDDELAYHAFQLPAAVAR